MDRIVLPITIPAAASAALLFLLVVLFIDEGTAHLDAASEAAVMEAIKALPIPRIVSAHRSAAIGSAERVFTVLNAQVVEAVRPARAKPGSEGVEAQMPLVKLMRQGENE